LAIELAAVCSRLLDPNALLRRLSYSAAFVDGWGIDAATEVAGSLGGTPTRIRGKHFAVPHASPPVPCQRAASFVEATHVGIERMRHVVLPHRLIPRGATARRGR